MKTLYDLVSRVLDARDGYGNEVNERRALRAAIWGTEQVTKKHKWKVYQSEATYQLAAPIAKTADLTSDGVLTISSGTLPTWILQGSILIDTQLYRVSKKLSTTSLQLENYEGASRSDYAVSLVNDRFVVKDELTDVYSIRRAEDDFDLTTLDPPSFLNYQVTYQGTTGSPEVANITTRQLGLNRVTEVALAPAPNTAFSVRIAYRRSARKVELVHDCGAITIDAGDLSEVTFTKPTRTDLYHSLVLVVGRSASKPDALFGYSSGEANPAETTLLVSEIVDNTTVTLEDDYQALEDRGGVLTQLLDLPPNCEEAAAMYAEAKYLQIGNGSYGDFWQMVQIADAELKVAIENEPRLDNSRIPAIRRSTYTRPETISLSDS